VWQDVGGGVERDPNDPNGPVLALTVFDDGGGAALFAGGTFLTAGGVSANRIARWRNDTWAPIGDGIQEPANAEVDALVGWPGSRLYVGGTMTLVGDNVAVRGIAAAERDSNDNWAWFTPGAGVFRASGAAGTVSSLAVLEVGGVGALYVGGQFVSVGTDPNDPNDPSDRIAARRIAKWDGGAWSPVSDGFGAPPRALTAYNDGFGLRAYAAGGFEEADGLSAPKIARLKGGKWAPLGRAPDFSVHALRGVTSWHHPRLFVGGGFLSVGDLKTGGLACWDGVAWSSIGLTAVNSLCTFDGGNGQDLFIGGGDYVITESEDEEGGPPGYIARGRMVPDDPNDPEHCNIWYWRWTNTADPNDPNVPISSTGAVSGAVRALAEFQDADNPNDPNDPCDPCPMVYAAGKFTEIDGRPARYVARLNLVDPNDPNHPWEDVGDPNDSNHPQGLMYALAVCPDVIDGQPALYAGGTGGVYKWRDNTWSHVGTDAVRILSLGVYQDPNDAQPTLYAGGGNYLMKWTGSWSALDNTPIYGSVNALCVYDDGGGSALYAGGWHPVNGNHLARWDGVTWEPVNHDAGDHVWALGVLADGLSEFGGLYVGGHFVTAGNSAPYDTDSQYIARWGCITACRGDLNHDGTVGFGDINPFVLALSNPAGYAAAYPGLAEVDGNNHFTGGLILFLGDLNCDGSVGFGDINPFVQRVTEGCCSAYCGPCQELSGDGMNAMSAPLGEDTGVLTPEQMAALLAENVDPADYDSLVERIAEYVAQQENPDEAAYWQTVYDALTQ
jgi:hypothetical protein